MTIQFKAENVFGERLLEWWEGLENDRASRAELRRADSILAITMSSAYRRIYRSLCYLGWEQEMNTPWYQDRLALAVGILAHIKHHQTNTPFAKAMSHVSNDKPVVSELRFKRLLESPDLASLLTGLRRILPLLSESNAPDILLLANDILYWGDAVKKRWSYAYEWPAK